MIVLTDHDDGRIATHLKIDRTTGEVTEDFFITSFGLKNGNYVEGTCKPAPFTPLPAPMF